MSRLGSFDLAHLQGMQLVSLTASVPLHQAALSSVRSSMLTPARASLGSTSHAACLQARKTADKDRKQQRRKARQQVDSHLPEDAPAALSDAAPVVEPSQPAALDVIDLPPAADSPTAESLHEDGPASSPSRAARWPVDESLSASPSGLTSAVADAGSLQRSESADVVTAGLDFLMGFGMGGMQHAPPSSYPDRSTKARISQAPTKPPAVPSSSGTDSPATEHASTPAASQTAEPAAGSQDAAEGRDGLEQRGVPGSTIKAVHGGKVDEADQAGEPADDGEEMPALASMFDESAAYATPRPAPAPAPAAAGDGEDDWRSSGDGTQVQCCSRILCSALN